MDCSGFWWVHFLAYEWQESIILESWFTLHLYTIHICALYNTFYYLYVHYMQMSDLARTFLRYLNVGMPNSLIYFTHENKVLLAWILIYIYLFLLVFLLSADPKQVLKWCLGSTAVGQQYGSVSALSFNKDCTRLLSGFAKGQVKSACSII